MNYFPGSFFLIPLRNLLFVFLPAVFILSLCSFCPAQDDGGDADDAVAIFNQGQEAHEKGDLAGAIKLYEKALEIVPEFPEAELQRGSACLSLGNLDEAEKAFRHASELRENWNLALANLGTVLVRKNQYAEAEKVLEKAIQLDDLNFPAFAAMTELRLKTGAKPEVLRALLDRLKILSSKANPTASILASQGALEGALGNKAAAKKSIDQSLAIDPKNRAALFERAEIALFESDTSRADDILKVLAGTSPESADLRFLRARVLLADDKFDEAVKVIESIPRPSAEMLALRDKIVANRSTNAPELEGRLEKDPKNVAVLGRLCVVLRLPDPPKALDYCKRAFELEPTNIVHAVGYGAALVQAKSYLQAVDLFRNILKFSPDNFTVHKNLATALFQLKRLPEAKVEYQWLLERKPDLVIAYYLLGITHDQLGEFMDAMANYQLFLKQADPETSKLEIEKVNLRLPILQKLIKEKKGKN
jgi:tetratricopeptide (TPR) repeat protein